MFHKHPFNLRTAHNNYLLPKGGGGGGGGLEDFGCVTIKLT